MKAGTRFDVAVFPLPNTVLFPGTTLPLHIFEKRYERMVQDVRSRGWPLAVSLVVPRNGHEFLLNTVCGAGEMQIFKEYPDGRADILVHGQERVKLHGFVQQEPYFVMEAEVLPPLASPRKPTRRQSEEFRALVQAWAFLKPSIQDELVPLFEEIRDAGELADFFVFHFLKQAAEKQVYLNMPNPIERMQMLTAYLENDLSRLGRRVMKKNRDTGLVLH